ncbi:hypothetical protein ACFFX0_12505 [Citricoccus parietis]|uniref:Uncharacterized protein n=1 Tax=Citricoccus parietis TaxID=592307 RepID=A0ABV5FZ78_9MICC
MPSGSAEFRSGLVGHRSCPAPVGGQDAITDAGANHAVQQVEEDRGKDDVEHQASDVSHDQRLPSGALVLTATGANVSMLYRDRLSEDEYRGLCLLSRGIGAPGRDTY